MFRCNKCNSPEAAVVAASAVIGGILAAPFGGYVVRHVRPYALMAVVGGLVSAVALFQVIKSFS
jgi:uncharacterized membrane protein YfcA